MSVVHSIFFRKACYALLVVFLWQTPAHSTPEEYSMPATNPAPVLTRLSLGELLSYSTTQLFAEYASGCSNGTGFVVFFQQSASGPRYPMLITNKHVIEGAERLRFDWTVCNQDGLPTKETYHCLIPLNHYPRFPHPATGVDGDVCALPLGYFWNAAEKEGKPLMLFPLNIHDMEKSILADALGPFSQLFMIGYPDGLRDTINNQPIIRTGIAATNPRLDFDSQKLFFIDMAVFPGSSGSPVIAYNDGTIYNPYTHSMVVDGQPRYVLLGLVSGNWGDYAPVNVATPQGQAIPLQDRIVRIPNNLGIVIKLDRILELEDLFFKHLQQSSELATERK